MDFATYLGYSPIAPQYGVMQPGPVAAPVDHSQTPHNPVPVSVGGSVSGNFAIAGWMAALILGLAAYRYVWEKSA